MKCSICQKEENSPNDIYNNKQKAITSLRHVLAKILILEAAMPIIIMVIAISILFNNNSVEDKTAVIFFMIAQGYGQILIITISSKLVNKILKENNLKNNENLYKKRLYLMIITEISIYIIAGIPTLLTSNFSITTILLSFIPNIITYSLIYIIMTIRAIKKIKNEM